MYRVMPTDPAPDGTYQGVSGVAPDEATDDEFTVVFKVPRLEAHVQDGADHYTIVLPRYVADELRQRAEENQRCAAQDGDSDAEAAATPMAQHTSPASVVYVSYCPEDSRSRSVAEYVQKVVVERHGATCVMLAPGDGKLNFIDFNEKLAACTHFLACTTEAYLQAVEQNSGRPFRELKAAVAALSSQRMLCLCLEAAGPVSHQRVQQIAPLELRKAFVNKSHIFPENMGHLDLFEANLCRFLRIQHAGELVQLPMAGLLDAHGLAAFLPALHAQLQCSRVDHLAGVSDEALLAIGMDAAQVLRLRSAVDTAMLVELLESVDCGGLAKRLLDLQSKQAAGGRASVAAEPVIASVRDVGHLSDALVKELCRGEGRYEATRAAVEQLRRMSAAERMALMTCDYFPAGDQPVKTLVAKLWSPGAPRRMRAQAAELIRRKTLTAAGLEETRHVAGLESLIKLVDEGPPAEKIAALWALRNFCLIDLYRARMPSIGVLELCLRLLDAGRAGPGVQHAAASVLQMLSIAEPATIKLISDQHALPKLASFLYGKHRGLKVAALATISNLAVTDDNKAACSRLRVVPRLVALLDRSVPADVAHMAVSALAQLVLTDVNRLKCWRCGGVERLKALVDRGLPRVSDVARQAVQVLMAGPRIHPSACFATAAGRQLDAGEMRGAIHRLNHQDTFLAAVNTSMTAFRSTNPQSMAVLTRPPPARRGAGRRAQSARTDRVAATHILRGEFLPPRPQSAGAAAQRQAGAAQEPERLAAPAPGPGPFSRPLVDHTTACSDFLRRLTPTQQRQLCARLAHRKPFAAEPRAGPAQRAFTRCLSTSRPAEVPAQPSAGSSRATGRFYTAQASKAYRTETGKLIRPSTIAEKDAKRAAPQALKV